MLLLLSIPSLHFLLPPPPSPTYNTWCPNYTPSSLFPLEPLFPPLTNHLSNKPSPPFSTSYFCLLSLSLCKNLPGQHDLVCHVVLSPLCSVRNRIFGGGRHRHVILQEGTSGTIRHIQCLIKLLSIQELAPKGNILIT